MSLRRLLSKWAQKGYRSVSLLLTLIGAMLLKLVPERWRFQLRLVNGTLCYNSQHGAESMIDIITELFLLAIDFMVGYLGVVFMVLCVLLTAVVVITFYAFLLPDSADRSYWLTAFHLSFGQWVLINIAYNYYKAVRTAPGCPPSSLPDVVTVCVRCIAPKPARAHHCFVCGRCVLKMDHHCPWLNNCVGHNNHRYFFLFTLFMFVGTIYTYASASFVYCRLNRDSYFRYLPFLPVFYERQPAANVSWPFGLTMQQLMASPTYSALLHTLVNFSFLVCFGVSWALGALTFWHVYLISSAQTNVEWHINLREAARLKQIQRTFRNPYDFGWYKNWRIFFGLTNSRSFVRHVLLPSGHATIGDGIIWDTYFAPQPSVIVA